MGGRIPTDPKLIVAFLEEVALTLLRTLAQPHGIDQATYDAALAESQGAMILKDSAQAYKHADSMRNAAGNLARNRDAILKAIANLRQVNPQAASTAARSLEPLLNAATRHIALTRDTERVIMELFSRGHAQRLAGYIFSPAGRTSGAMLSKQLLSQRVLLLPDGVSQLGWVQQVVFRIRSLPITPAEVVARARELGVVVSTYAAGARGGFVAARLLVPPLVEALFVFLVSFGARLTMPLVLFGEPPSTKTDI